MLASPDVLHRRLPVEPLLTLAAAGYELGVSVDTLRRWSREERIRTVRLPSGRLRVPSSELDRILGASDANAR